MRNLVGKGGNAATEYVLLAAVVVAILGGVSQGTEHYCIKNLGGSLVQCNSVPRAVALAFEASLEDIAFLINLPF